MLELGERRKQKTNAVALAIDALYSNVPPDLFSITPNTGIGVYMTGGSDDDWYAMSQSQFSVWKGESTKKLHTEK